MFHMEKETLDENNNNNIIETRDETQGRPYNEKIREIYTIIFEVVA